MSVLRSIETSELNTLTCNVKETDVTMCDGRRRKYKKHKKTMRCILHKQEELSCEKKILLENLITYNST